MSVAVVPNPAAIPDPVDMTQQEFIVDGLLTLSNNYGGSATHGDTMNLAGLVPSNLVPNRVEIFEAPAAGNAPTGYNFIYGFGSGPANGVLIVTQCAGASAPSSEITEGAAYPGALTAATANIRFRAWFTKFI